MVVMIPSAETASKLVFAARLSPRFNGTMIEFAGFVSRRLSFRQEGVSPEVFVQQCRECLVDLSSSNPGDIPELLLRDPKKAEVDIRPRIVEFSRIAFDRYYNGYSDDVAELLQRDPI